jgi:hypothetical protein
MVEVKDIRDTPHPDCSAETQIFVDARHPRRKFLVGGEGWACAGSMATYDTLSGSATHGCAKKGEYHLQFPWGVSPPKHSSESTNCVIYCKTHAKSALGLIGIKTLKLL